MPASRPSNAGAKRKGGARRTSRDINANSRFLFIEFRESYSPALPPPSLPPSMRAVIASAAINRIRGVAPFVVNGRTLRCASETHPFNRYCPPFPRDVTRSLISRIPDPFFRNPDEIPRAARNCVAQGRVANSLDKSIARQVRRERNDAAAITRPERN